jgi:hypothetical protein
MIVSVGGFDHSEDRQHGRVEGSMGIFHFLHIRGVFLLIASGGCCCSIAKPCCSASAEVINPQPKQKTLAETHPADGLSIGGVVEHFENSVMPKSQAEVSVVISA